MYQAALQLNAHDRGLIAGDKNLRYNNGFWALQVDDLPGCEGPQFVPFMSGYGGISLVSVSERRQLLLLQRPFRVQISPRDTRGGKNPWLLSATPR